MTTIEETLTKLLELKLTSMAHAVRELMDTAPGHQMSFEEKLGVVVDREWSDRDNRRLARRLKDAKLATRASLDNVLCDPERGIDKATLRGLSSCQWVKSKHNVVIVGKTGVGKATSDRRSPMPPAETATAQSSFESRVCSKSSRWRVLPASMRRCSASSRASTSWCWMTFFSPR